MRKSAKAACWRFLTEEQAPTVVEYGLLLALIGLLVFTAVVTLGDGISTFFTETGNAFSGAVVPTIP
jgi:Flp pilus assembly pilin Flp